MFGHDDHIKKAHDPLDLTFAPLEAIRLEAIASRLDQGDQGFA